MVEEILPFFTLLSQKVHKKDINWTGRPWAKLPEFGRNVTFHKNFCKLFISFCYNVIPKIVTLLSLTNRTKYDIIYVRRKERGNNHA